jgi:hypothetical protein
LDKPSAQKDKSSSSSDTKVPVYEAPEITLDQEVDMMPEPKKSKVTSSSSSDKEAQGDEAPGVTLT